MKDTPPPVHEELKSEFKKVHEGPRWSLLFGRFDGVEKTAVIELQKILQYYLPYALEVRRGVSREDLAAGHVAVIGTVENNPLIAELVQSGKLDKPKGKEGYSIALLDSPWGTDRKVLAITGTDENGLLYGVQEAAARLFAGGTLLDGPGGSCRLKYLETRLPFAAAEAPAVRDRGLWTWGYVISSYRGFLDNMMRLKMNMITIWNDQVPLNIEEVIEYAHQRGIRVVLGFHWGWGFKGSLDISQAEDRRKIREVVLQTYRSQYAHLKHDGIYFQTLTEHKDKALSGRSTAAWACELVNDTAASLLAEFPDLSIQFGLHATSIAENYVDLATLDPRVTITWEDYGGQVPYSYYPAQVSEITSDFEGVLAYSKKIAAFRPGTDFAIVPKGWTCIRWLADFENHGSFILGEQAPLHARERLLLKQNDWDEINIHWFKNYPLAARFYREILEVNPAMTVSALVEDGLFEEKIQPSVALLGEMLWNPRQSDAEILERAMRPYYSRIS